MTKIWGVYLEDVARAIRVLNKMTEDLNKGQPDTSDLEFMVPTEIEVHLYGEKAFTLVLEDDWFLKVEEDK